MRLIDADKIENYQCEGTMSLGDDNFGLRKFVLLPIESLSEIPTVDAVPVVHCKDCGFGHYIVPCKAAKTNHALLRYKCSKIRGEHKPEFYCFYGKK